MAQTVARTRSRAGPQAARGGCVSHGGTDPPRGAGTGRGDATDTLRAPPFEGDGSYQCTPFMRFAMAICSMDAFSLGSFSPLAAAESGNTL